MFLYIYEKYSKTITFQPKEVYRVIPLFQNIDTRTKFKKSLLVSLVANAEACTSAVWQQQNQTRQPGVTAGKSGAKLGRQLCGNIM